jgi:hypothetical protein
MKTIQEAVSAKPQDSKSTSMDLLKHYENRVITLWNELVFAGSLADRKELLRHQYRTAYLAYRLQLELVRSE